MNVKCVAEKKRMIYLNRDKSMIRERKQDSYLIQIIILNISFSYLSEKKMYGVLFLYTSEYTISMILGWFS